jgi:glutamate-1-semialdehyde aminotransferase
MFEHARRLCPGGVMGIRRPYNFVEGEYPIFISHGKGGHIFDVDGNEYIDMLCSFGPLILGHTEAEIDQAVIAQMQKGFCFSLVQPVQNELESRLSELIPCAENVILVKTGSDATTVAVRIARAYTEKIEILRCGYHGWHDWCVEVKGGVPPEAQAHTHGFRFNDLGQLEALMKEHKGNVAAIIMTPIGHELSEPLEEPTPGFLQAVRELATDNDVLLIFDEIRTGFRLSMGGAQELYGVTPDLATFGKAMANGYPISAVVGKREYMSVMESKAFLSSTFFPNSLEMVAALKTIEILQRENVLEKLRERGEIFRRKLVHIVEESSVPCKSSGLATMPYITFDRDEKLIYRERRMRFYTETIRRGLFLHPYHHWYICYRHTAEDLKRASAIIEEALSEVRKAFQNQ